jgi:hypothetical protein
VHCRTPEVLQGLCTAERRKNNLRCTTRNSSVALCTPEFRNGKDVFCGRIPERGSGSNNADSGQKINAGYSLPDYGYCSYATTAAAV